MPSAAGDGLGRRTAGARGGWRPDPERVTATAVGNGAESRALVVDVRLAGHGSDSVSDQAVARRLPAVVMLTSLWLGSVVSVSHGLYGMVTKGLYVAGFAQLAWAACSAAFRGSPQGVRPSRVRQLR